jgi:uncharacterized protein YyaL (SSP411 family)
LSNLLRSASSPYLLQHADNPVDWYPWCDEALARARAEDKPIFLSIGYAACHWCHVMAHESFEDPETAALMNAHFVSIKVDREERPDLDSVYMQAVVGLTGSGGWPLSVFLTPQAQPFFGGTYWPPERRHGMLAFREVLRRIAEAWRERREAVLAAGLDLTRALQALHLASQPTSSVSGDLLPAAAEKMCETYDWQHGGWGGAPKFPQPLAIEFLLQRALVGSDRRALDAARHALTSLANSGIHDQIGGGFHRYAVDAGWTVPHFEKMLYDNAMLARAFLHGWQLTGEPYWRSVLDTTLRFILREMRHPSGGLFASLDADSAGGEGTFYIWTYEEALQALRRLPQHDLALALLGITREGNFEGRTVLHRPGDLTAVADAHGLSTANAEALLKAASELLLAQRATRHRPATDDKIVAEWNGLGLIVLAEAARATGSTDYLRAASDLASFLADCLVEGDRVYRTWRDGRQGPPGMLADHAALSLGFLAQYQTDFDLRWFDLAERLANAILRDFIGADGLLYDTASGHEALILRPRSLEDNPTPSGGSLSLLAVLQLAALSGEARYQERAEDVLRQLPGAAPDYPTAFAGWLAAADIAHQPARQLAIIGRLDDPHLRQMAEVAWNRFDPRLALAAGEGERPALLKGRTMLKGSPTAYLCTDFACRLPTSDPPELRRQLAARPAGT